MATITQLEGSDSALIRALKLNRNFENVDDELVSLANQISQGSESTTASNGLSLVGDDVRLGGTLSSNTIIMGGGFSLNLSNIRNFNVTVLDQIQFTATDFTFLFDDLTNTISFTDNRTTPLGIQYAADYSSTLTDRSLVDRGFVDTRLSGMLTGTLTANATVDTSTFTIVLQNLPTAVTGLPTGALWNNAGVLNVAP